MCIRDRSTGAKCNGNRCRKKENTMTRAAQAWAGEVLEVQTMNKSLRTHTSTSNVSNRTHGVI